MDYFRITFFYFFNAPMTIKLTYQLHDIITVSIFLIILGVGFSLSL